MIQDTVTFWGIALSFLNGITIIGVGGTLKKMFNLEHRVSKIEGYLNAHAESHNPGSSGGGDHPLSLSE